MDHPFKVGVEYRNRNGRYQVLAIEEPKMLIRYEDGREDIVTIAIQARIWDTIQFEAQQSKVAPSQSKGKKKKRTRSTRQGYDFFGLKDGDFKSNIAGTHWRRRESLGGRLAQQLSDTTPYLFQSHAIYRRPAVYVIIPEHYDPDNGIPYAKYEFRLSSDGAQYGFYIERADKSWPMDSTWHWQPFLRELETNVVLHDQLVEVMTDYNLKWLLQLEEGEGKSYLIKEQIEVQSGSPLLWNGTDELNWTKFVDRLRSIPSNQWLNVHLCAWTEKSEAHNDGEQISDRVTRVFRAILPLYLASVGLNNS